MQNLSRLAAGWTLALSCLVLGAGDCGGSEPAPTGCSRDSECATGAYCRDADGECYSYGYCETARDCSEQPLTHTACTGNWTCTTNRDCAWACSVVLPRLGETCASNGACDTELTCLRYNSIAGHSGPEFTTCEKACSTSLDCASGMVCVTISDGPGQVCRARNG